MSARVRCRRCGWEFVAQASRADEMVRCGGCGSAAQAASYEVLVLMDGGGGAGLAAGIPAAAPAAPAAPAVGVVAQRARGVALPPSDLRVGRNRDSDWEAEPVDRLGTLVWELRLEGAAGMELRARALARNRAALTVVTTALASVLAAGLLVLGISKHLYEGDGVMGESEGAAESMRRPVAGGPVLDRQMEQHLAAIRMAEVVGEAEEAAMRFLGAGSARERLELIHEPERHREEVEQFQERHPGGLTLEGELVMERASRREEGGGHIVLFLARTRESRGEPKLFLLQETEGAPFKVDWQYFHQFHEGSLESFLDGEVGMEGEFFIEFTRVQARGEIPPFGDHSLAYRIMGIDGEDVQSYFFVDERTDLGQAIRDASGWQRASATRVRLRWEQPVEGSERTVPFLRLTWMQD